MQCVVLRCFRSHIDEVQCVGNHPAESRNMNLHERAYWTLTCRAQAKETVWCVFVSVSVYVCVHTGHSIGGLLAQKHLSALCMISFGNKYSEPILILTHSFILSCVDGQTRWGQGWKPRLVAATQKQSIALPQLLDTP